MYLAASGTATASLGLVHLLFDSLPKLRHTSLRFVMAFAVENLFVLLMAVFHWPYELLHGTQFGETEPPKGTPDNVDFFVNGEDQRVEPTQD
jgi:hypothetical protein